MFNVSEFRIPSRVDILEEKAKKGAMLRECAPVCEERVLESADSDLCTTNVNFRSMGVSRIYRNSYRLIDNVYDWSVIEDTKCKYRVYVKCLRIPSNQMSHFDSKFLTPWNKLRKIYCSMRRFRNSKKNTVSPCRSSLVATMGNMTSNILSVRLATMSLLTILMSLNNAPLTSAYVTSGLPKSTHEGWLKKMTVDICQHPQGELTPEMLLTAPKLMSAWSVLHNNSKKRRNTIYNKHKDSYANKIDHGKECALAVESILKRVIDERIAGNEQVDVPDTHAYNCIIEGWARSGGGEAAAERCEEVLEKMQENFENGQEQVRPNYDSFKSVLLAWRTSGFKDSPLRAQRILEWMIRLYREEIGKNSDDANRYLPDCELFDIILQAWARSGQKDAATQSEMLLHTLEQLQKETGSERLKPRTSSFNAVLAAWSKSSEEGAANRASKILGFMELLSETGHNQQMEPNLISYSTVVGAISKTSDPQIGSKAELCLQHVEAGFNAGKEHLEPDTILYNCVITCWSKSREKGGYIKARAALDRQVSLYKTHKAKRSCPNVYGFTSVLACCAVAQGTKTEKAAAFQVAIETFSLLRSNKEFGSPNHVTYGTMIKSCARLLPLGSDLRRTCLRKIFALSMQDGCVGDMVVSQLRDAASPTLYNELMEGHKRGEVPVEWCRNVNEKREYRKNMAKSLTRKTAKQ